jgi:hypothetical protein
MSQPRNFDAPRRAIGRPRWPVLVSRQACLQVVLTSQPASSWFLSPLPEPETSEDSPSRRRQEGQFIHLGRRRGDAAPAVGTPPWEQRIRARGEQAPEPARLLIGRGRGEPRRARAVRTWHPGDEEHGHALGRRGRRDGPVPRRRGARARSQPLRARTGADQPAGPSAHARASRLGRSTPAPPGDRRHGSHDRGPDVLQLRGVKFLPSGDSAGAGGLVVVARGTARYPKPCWVSS